MRTFTQSLSPGLPKRCSESRVGRTTFAQTMHLANACRFNSSSTLLQQASHCESTSYVLSIRTFRLTLLVVGAIGFLAHVGKHSVLHASSDCVFEALGIEQPRELRRGEEGVTNRLGAPFFECGRPVPRKEVGAHRVFNVTILTKAIQYQFHEGISRARMHQAQINRLPTVVFSQKHQ